MSLSFFVVVAIFLFGYGIFKKLNLNFYKFLYGSIGLFSIIMIFFLSPLDRMLSEIITSILSFIGEATNWFEVYNNLSIIMIEGFNGIVSMKINYECSGIIELLVFSSLVVFFPFVNFKNKIYSLVFGNMYICLSNIIRILFIIFVVKTFGVEYYYLSHVILARILFFILMVFLYYVVFTKNHIKNQKVGEIT